MALIKQIVIADAGTIIHLDELNSLILKCFQSRLVIDIFIDEVSVRPELVEG